MNLRSKKDDLPDPKEPVCRLMQEMLEVHMAEFNPRHLKELEDSGKLLEYLEERSSQARLSYLQCRKAGHVATSGRGSSQVGPIPRARRKRRGG